MTEWRPRNWSNPYPNPNSFSVYEAGADAMLTELLAKGWKVNNIDIPMGKGTVIFIPEEEDL